MNLFLGLVQGIPATLLLWAAGQLLGAAIAVPVAWARMSPNRWVRIPATVWIEAFRGIPTLVWLFIIFFGLAAAGFNLTAMGAAIAAFGIVSSAYIAEVYRAGFESVPRQQFEAAASIGLPAMVRVRVVILPQALPVILEGGASYSIHLLKETALASLIGVVDVMAIANYQVERGANGPLIFVVAGTIYLLFGLALAWGANRLGRRYSFRRSVPTARKVRAA